MTKLHFQTSEEFETLFTNQSKKVTDAIVLGIEKAMQENKRSALLFEITFEQAERAFEISLPQIEWVRALESCLAHYHTLELADEAIDTWKLLEAAKSW